MDLLRLGAQSRKTGLKPKAGLTKDKFDMEDIDEFFDETSWSDSRKSVPPEEKHDGTKSNPKAAQKKTLGVRRMKSNHNDTASSKSSGSKIASSGSANESSRLSESRFKDKPESYVLKLQDTPLDIDNSEPPSEAHSPFLDPIDFNDNDANDHFDEEHSDMGARNDQASIMSPERSITGHDQASLPSPSHNSPTQSSKFTKAMALHKTKGKRGRPKIVESDLDDEGDEIRKPGDRDIYPQTQESSEDELGSSQPTQLHDTYQPSQPSPLPSPPPEGLRRSKRRRIAPLAYWRNERIVYSRANESNGDPDSTLIKDIRKVPLQEISAVVHVPATIDKKNAVKRSKVGKANQSSKNTTLKSGSAMYDYESDPEIEGSEWFKDKFLETEVFENEETKATRVIAWAPDGGEYQSPPASKNGQQVAENFRVAPLFDADSETIAAGMLEFPFEGFKSLRTTGESLFMFHVTRGLIEVTLNSEKFVVTRGCSFEVPKFNIYSFKNLGQGQARMFFVQCKV